jgi:16S rRNA (cytosine1402-N4)-methyltransferase
MISTFRVPSSVFRVPGGLWSLILWNSERRGRNPELESRNPEPLPMAESDFHVPVLLDETVSVLEPAEGKLILDGTVGGGGHALALLVRGASIIACDQDPDALAAAAKRLDRYKDRMRWIESNFADLADRLRELNIAELDGILLDLGVSSHQLDTASRGFSFQLNGPLDMRMNPHAGRTAADIVNTAPEAELADIFHTFGEERAAKRIAARLIKERARSPIRTTQSLATIVESVVPRRGPKHPATRVFQALRIAVNNELEVLKDALQTLSGFLRIGGRMAIITFHSLEDRIVKSYFREVTQEWIDRPEWPAPRKNPAWNFRLIKNRPIEPSREEIDRNPRARSAKLRVIERIRP